jgi:hypothetical protein
MPTNDVTTDANSQPDDAQRAGQLRALYDQGLAAAKQGRREQAERYFEAMLATDPDNELAWLKLAELSEDRDLARTICERVLARNPDSTGAVALLETLDLLRRVALPQASVEPTEEPSPPEPSAEPAPPSPPPAQPAPKPPLAELDGPDLFVPPWETGTPVPSLGPDAPRPVPPPSEAPPEPQPPLAAADVPPASQSAPTPEAPAHAAQEPAADALPSPEPGAPQEPDETAPATPAPVDLVATPALPEPESTIVEPLAPSAPRIAEPMDALLAESTVPALDVAAQLPTAEASNEPTSEESKANVMSIETPVPQHAASPDVEPSPSTEAPVGTPATSYFARNAAMLVMLGIVLLGSLALVALASNETRAERVRAALGVATDTPTPTMTPSETLTPTPSATPTITVTPSPSPTWSPTPSITPSPTPTLAWATQKYLPLPLEEKWIEVDLSEQMLWAYEGTKVVFKTKVSSGRTKTPTVLGKFRIQRKYESQLMTGPGYYLPAVPWVMYFYGNYALHGAYWHNNWGVPMSHGCINLKREDAKWLYNWADPPMPEGVKALDSTKNTVPGTWVLIHE